MRIPIILMLACFTAGHAFAQAAPQPPTNPPPTPAPQNWAPRNEADLRVLNKVDAHVAQVVLRPGQTAQFGTLAVTLKSCVSRPADEAADSAAYLLVQDSRVGVPPFSGWMLAREPGLGMIEHPLYNIRLLSCR